MAEIKEWDNEGYHWPEAFSDESGKSSIMPIIALFLVVVGGLGFLACLTMMFIVKDAASKTLYQSSLVLCLGVITVAIGGQGAKGWGDSKVALAKLSNLLPDNSIVKKSLVAISETSGQKKEDGE